MKLLTLLFVLTSLNAFADSFEFECEGSDLVHVNSFSMSGMVDTSDKSISYDIVTRNAGNNGAVVESVNVEREARFERLEDETTGDFLGYRAYSIDKDSEHVYVNILMNYAGQLTSQVRNADGVVYRSTCKAL